MVVNARFLDPFQEDIVAFPSDRAQISERDIVDLIVGAVIFLTVVAIYNALFSIWERIFQRQLQMPQDISESLEERDDVIIRVTYAGLVVVLSYFVIRYFRTSRGRAAREVW